MWAKLTGKDIDIKLIDRKISIIRLGDYISARTPIDFQCVNQHIWKATPDNILRGKGCPQCLINNLRLSDEKVDKILNNYQIKKNQPYINGRFKIEFKCLKYNCEYVWKTRPDYIIYGGHGCPKCFGRARLTNKIIDEKLYNKSIKRLDNFVDAYTKIQWKCTKDGCGQVWMANPSSIIYDEGNCCPECSGRRKYINRRVWSQNDIDEELRKRKIKRLEKYINHITKIEFQCLIENCKHIWKTTPNHILNINSRTGCPLCRNKNEKLLFELLKENNIDFEYQKNIKELSTSENKNIIIEYNGAQHYQPVRFGGMEKEIAKKNFIKQQERDRYIEKLCNINNIKLISIDGRKYVNNKLKILFETELINEIGVNI